MRKIVALPLNVNKMVTMPFYCMAQILCDGIMSKKNKQYPMTGRLSNFTFTFNDISFRLIDVSIDNKTIGKIFRELG